ncbi:Npun_R2821/Npun_R2822 family protein [Crocosphaera sp.]|uniref:Npun_R2821/Npun_R2822 family protein n=1 Tax=Crocosphaera sp. TaxID=2729996 RepID=UPI002625A44E|nr:Npun_R2821/Npun_R2822 family protein [Crocosphaera sp.]MDJ0582842.1 sugar transferase [Crocosphaera sp.]
MDGICTLGNDYVFDQVVALLNSIEVIYGQKMPVCIYPYDDNTDKLAAEIASRPQVTLYNDSVSMERWDSFAKAVWDTHPTARQTWEKAGSKGYHRFGTHRRYCAFDGPFDRFIYMDADTILMSNLDSIFAQLDDNDCIIYDFQHKDLTHVYDVNSNKLRDVFPEERLNKEIFCSGFYGSKKDLFSEEKRNELINYLDKGEAEILYCMAPDQTIINYMMMRSDFSIYNLALNLPQEEKTGCCVTSSHFENKDNILYDKGNRLTYIHYIGISSQIFKKVCQGENIDFPYRDIFLYYRYHNQPENLPKFTQKAVYYQQKPTVTQKILKKLGLN